MRHFLWDYLNMQVFFFFKVTNNYIWQWSIIPFYAKHLNKKKVIKYNHSEFKIK